MGRNVIICIICNIHPWNKVSVESYIRRKNNVYLGEDDKLRLAELTEKYVRKMRDPMRLVNKSHYAIFYTMHR